MTSSDIIARALSTYGAMTVVLVAPPIMERAVAKFGEPCREAIFCWGYEIRNPADISIDDFLVVHERVHSIRQHEIGIEEWWERYLTDDDFRIEEEVLAHRAEYEHRIGKHQAQHRRMRRFYMNQTIERVRNPMYRYRLSAGDARRRLKTAGAYHVD